MHWRNKGFALLIMVVSLSSCFEDDVAIDPVERTNSSIQIDAGATKRQVNFVSLDEGKVIQKVDPLVWDISFENGALTMNGFRSMQAAEISGDWSAVTDTAGLDFDYLSTDYSGKIWELKINQTYVLNMGLDEEFETIGFMKFKCEESAGNITLRFSKLDTADFDEVEVPNDRFYYSILNREEADVVFPSEYDFALGRYTDFVIFPDEQEFYKVYGAILGEAKARQFNQPFDAIQPEYRDSMTGANDKQTNIGWDWKSYNIQEGVYKVYEENTYVVESNSGFVYKLRFIDYYNTKGVSGHPTFEFELL